MPPSDLTRPKPLGFSAASGFEINTAFSAWNTRTGEVLNKNPEGSYLKCGNTRNGTIDASWFQLGYQDDDKIIFSIAGKAYGSASLTISGGAAQKAGTVTAVTTALPAFNM